MVDTLNPRCVLGELRLGASECMATVGACPTLTTPTSHFGKMRAACVHKGYRPSVRVFVISPIDHPHGGGEAGTSGGPSPCYGLGQAHKGCKTRNTETKRPASLSYARAHAKKTRALIECLVQYGKVFCDIFNVLKKPEASAKAVARRSDQNLGRAVPTILPPVCCLNVRCVQRSQAQSLVNVSEEMNMVRSL